MEESNMPPIALGAIASWYDANPCQSASIPAPHDTTNNAPHRPIFPVDEALNARISLWNGAIWRLQLDAIVNSTNESLKDTSGLCRHILEAAGKEIWVECEAVGTCRTGEAVITRGCQLPARHIIHTVGPRYNLKYKNAAENALHMCYRSSLSVAKEENVRTIALSCIYIKRKGYPRDDAAHIAARTVRRFLEHYRDDFDRVVFCVDSLEDQMIYESILPLYFPRTAEDELKQLSRLASHHLGDEFGEPIIEERKIRIRSLGSRAQDNQLEASQSGQLDYEDDDSTDDEETALQDFREMSIDPDIERLEKLRQLQQEREKRALKEQAAVKKQNASVLNYQTALAQAQRERFDDLRAMKFLYNAGVDHSGCPVIVYLACNLPVDDVDLDRVMLYVIQTMDAIVENTYSVMYVHTDVKDENQPNASWLKRLFRTFASKYQANLRFFYMLEPTMWLKLLVLISKGFVSSEFYKKIVYLPTVKDIDNVAETLDLPAHIYPKKAKAPEQPLEAVDPSAPPTSNQHEEHEAVL
uniref:Macro domain-containing protein n=1 Tax=Globisporangium ultimum (strain ATCC 200006 / CBS 805.95 / DAOM BR144) TaxID=431595 RepID=K3WWZ1_GLOUD